MHVDAAIDKKLFVEVLTKNFSKEWLLDNDMGVFCASNLTHFLSKPNSTKSKLVFFQKMHFWKIGHLVIHPLTGNVVDDEGTTRKVRIDGWENASGGRM